MATVERPTQESECPPASPSQRWENHHATHVGYFEALGRLDIDLVVKLMTVTFRPMDLIFYAIGVYEGYRFSFHK